MFINDDEAKTRLSSLDNLINKLQLKRIHNGGRPLNRKNDTDDARERVAETAIIKGPTQAAIEHDTTISRASLLSKGIITHGLGNDEELTPRVVSKRQQVHEKALDIIVASLGQLEPQLNGVKKARDLSAIAADMAKIADRTTPREVTADGKPNVQVIVYAPRIRDESEYDVVEIG